MKDLQDFVKERPQIPESVSHILSLSTEWQETDSQNDNHDFEIADAEQESKIQGEKWTIELWWSKKLESILWRAEAWS